MYQDTKSIRWLDHKPEVFEYNGKWIKNWFSNMVPFSIHLTTGPISDFWPSVENYYQAMKTIDIPTQEAIRQATPSQSKQMGRRLSIRADWEQIKESVMKRALDIKFAQEPWYGLLMATGDAPIIEWNNWGDREWGVTLDGKGKNKLGLLLMQIREEYRSLRQSNPTLGLGYSDEQKEKMK